MFRLNTYKMNNYIYLFVLFTLWTVASTSNKDENLLEIRTMGVEFKENTFIFNNEKSLKNVMVNNQFFNLDSTREVSVSHSTHYNETITLNFLCYGINFTGHHILTWHHVIGDTEVETVSLDTLEPNNNYTFQLTSGTFDNESVVFCTASVPYTGEIINRTEDFKLKMNDIFTEEFVIIKMCKGNYSDGSITPCEFGDRTMQGLEVSQRRKPEYSTGYGYIEPAYYNEYFPTVTHKCSKADKSILKAPDGSVQVNVNETFTFDKSDSGTVIFCSRFVNILKDLEPNEHKVKRETYNERMYIYNRFYWEDNTYSANSTSIIFIIGIAAIIMANVVGVIFCIRGWLKNRRNRRENSSSKSKEKPNITEQLREMCKWKKTGNDH